MMYHKANGVPHDDKKAFELFQRCADLGAHQCAFNLGVFHRDALVGPRDAASASFWFSVAAAGEIPEAHAKAKAMKAELTAAQVAAADKRVAEWLARHRDRDPTP
jgi:TPR repeat protein